MEFVVYLFAILKNMIYGSTVFFTGELSASVDVLDVLALRYLMSLVVFWLLKLLRVIKIEVGIKDFFKKGERTGALKNLLLTALFEPVLYMLFETLGVFSTTTVTAAVILALAPITSCICEMIFLGERNTLLQKIFLALGIAGVVFIAVNTNTSDGQNSVLGIIFLLLAVCTGSLFSVFSRRSSKSFSAMEITYISCALGAVVFNAANVIRHLVRGDILSYFNPYFDVDNLIGFVVLAILSTVVATAMNNFALSHMQVSTMAAFGGLSTLTTIFIGVIFGGEELYYFHYIGLSLILARMIGVSVIAIRRDRQKARDELATADNGCEKKE